MDVSSFGRRSGLVRVRGRCLSAAGWFVLSACGGRGPFFLWAVSLMGVLASSLARLNCRRFLAGQFFLSVNTTPHTVHVSQ